MLKFFRKIRQNLLAENKFQQYLLYAIGEILLVMIGILLALQVNNWNENRKTVVERSQLYQSLAKEFLVAKEIHQAKKLEQKAIHNAGLKILRHTGPNKETLRIWEFDSLLSAATLIHVFNPSFVVYREILATNKIELIDNAKIKALLYDYQAIDTDYQELANISLTNLSSEFVPYLNKRIAFKNIDVGRIEWIQPSTILTDNRAILLELEFENLLHTRHFLLSGNIELFEQLGEIMDELLLELDIENNSY